MFSEKSNVSLYLGNSCILLTPVMLRKVCRKQNNHAKIEKKDELTKLQTVFLHSNFFYLKKMIGKVNNSIFMLNFAVNKINNSTFASSSYVRS